MVLKKFVNSFRGMRVNQRDFQTVAEDSMIRSLAQMGLDFLTGNDSPTTISNGGSLTEKQAVIFGFGVTNPSGQDIQVAGGVAFAGIRGTDGVTNGVLVSSETIKTQNISAYAASVTYGVYIRLVFREDEFENRPFWNANAVTPAEISKNIPTKLVEDYEIAIERVSPGDEWVHLADVTKDGGGSITAVTDQRKFYFEGTGTNYEVVDADWGDVVADRDDDRASLGVFGMGRFVKAMLRSVQDIRGVSPELALLAGSGGVFATMASESFEVRFDGGAWQVITLGTEGTQAAARTEINNQVTGGSAIINGANLDLRSDTLGVTDLGAPSQVETRNVDAGITTKLGIPNDGDSGVARKWWTSSLASLADLYATKLSKTGGTIYGHLNASAADTWDIGATTRWRQIFTEFTGFDFSWIGDGLLGAVADLEVARIRMQAAETATGQKTLLMHLPFSAGDDRRTIRLYRSNTTVGNATRYGSYELVQNAVWNETTDTWSKDEDNDYAWLLSYNGLGLYLKYRDTGLNGSWADTDANWNNSVMDAGIFSGEPHLSVFNLFAGVSQLATLELIDASSADAPTTAGKVYSDTIVQARGTVRIVGGNGGSATPSVSSEVNFNAAAVSTPTVVTVSFLDNIGTSYQVLFGGFTNDNPGASNESYKFWSLNKTSSSFQMRLTDDLGNNIDFDAVNDTFDFEIVVIGS